MSDEHVLAIDVGTGSARAMLFTAKGHQAGTGQREYSHREIPGVPGSQVFDTTANWALSASACATRWLTQMSPRKLCAP